ncbi:MAG: efflux RND transporter periplasmic adaptor subunit, partial [Bradyrhizobiaceae bacterium]|nr:efflux RND transporter periplasmic adaptor subunit [Bradyrhizobiaceae bacterium]
VRVATVKSSGDTISVTLPGTTEAFEAASIYSRTSGYIAKRRVDIGDHVKTGDLLAEITAPELDHQIAQAQATIVQTEAALRQAEANREIARVTWERDSKLLEKGWVTKQQGDQERLTLLAQESAVAVAHANLEAQKAQLMVLEQRKAYQRVVAPFDGVVTARNIDNGSLVSGDATGGTSMFTVMHSDVIRIQLYVPQDEAFGLKAGVEATVRVPELPGHDFKGAVTRIASALQPGTRTLLTEIDVPNRDDLLTPGTYCQVELKIPRRTPSLILPAEAIIFNRTGLNVAVVEHDRVHIRKVALVRDMGTAVEVNDGVRDGDHVILNPPVNITEGQTVNARIVTPPNAS